VALFFIHARLLGRVAWLAGFRTPALVERVKKRKRKRPRPLASHDPWAVPEEAQAKPAPQPPSSTQARQVETAITVRDPWAIPSPVEPRPQPSAPALQEDEDEWAPNKKPYGVAHDTAHQPPPLAYYLPDPNNPMPQPYNLPQIDPPPPQSLKEEELVPPVQSPSAEEEEEDEWTPNKKPYALKVDSAPSAKESDPALLAAGGVPDEAIAAGPPPAPPLDIAPELPRMSRLEIDLWKGDRLPPPPAHPLLSGVWTFPFYDPSLRPMVNMSFLGLILCLLLRFLLSMWMFS
jgi:hypothetical protein